MILFHGQSLRLRPVRRRNTCSSVGRSIWKRSIGVVRGDAIELGERIGGLQPLLLAVGLDDQRRRTAVRRQQLVERAEREQLAGVDDRDAIAEPLGFFHVVRRVDDGAAFAVQRLDALEDLVARLRIDADRRLVEQQQLRIVHHRRGQVEAPLHAAGIAADAIALAIGEADEIEAPLHALVERRAGQAVDLAEEAQVLFAGQQVVERERLRRDADLLAHRGIARDCRGPRS